MRHTAQQSIQKCFFFSPKRRRKFLSFLFSFNDGFWLFRNAKNINCYQPNGRVREKNWVSEKEREKSKIFITIPRACWAVKTPKNHHPPEYTYTHIHSHDTEHIFNQIPHNRHRISVLQTFFLLLPPLSVVFGLYCCCIDFNIVKKLFSYYFMFMLLFTIAVAVTQ